jgi:hypothetical protein
MKIGIVGSRRRNSPADRIKIVYQVSACAYAFKEELDIISGGCYLGADKFAEEIAKDCNYDITIHRPNYYKYGRKATFVRNELIAKDSDILIACVSPDRKGGTEDTIRKFKKYHPDGKLIIV